jgi:hypothetical protein
MLGVTAFLDHNWNSRWSSAVGYSLLDIDNSAGQTPDAFGFGDYALANALYTPATNVMVGAEVQWGRRENFLDDFSSDDLRVQFGARFNWSWTALED